MTKQTRYHALTAVVAGLALLGLSCLFNRAPDVPAVPTGPTVCYKDSTYTFAATATDPDGDSVSVHFQWTEAWISEWTSLLPSGDTFALVHAWYDSGTFQVRVEARDLKERASGWSEPLTVQVIQLARLRPPYEPDVPTGPEIGNRDSSYAFTTFAFHQDSLPVAVRFSWGDGDTSDWSGLVAAGETVVMSHAWADTGEFLVSAQAKDTNDQESEWSGEHTIEILPPDTLRKWRVLLDSSGGVSSSPALGPDGTVYVGSSDHSLYAVNPDGTLKWQYPVAGPVHSSPAIAPDGTIYFGCDDSRLYAINPDGTPKWRHAIGGACRTCPAIAADGTVYVGTNSRYLYAVNPDGTHKWAFLTGDAIRSSPAVGTDGTVYFGSLDHCLYALRPDGTIAWSCTTGGDVYSSPALGADGTIYVGSDDDCLYAFYPDSTPKWNFLSGGNVRSSPAIATDGTVCFGSYDEGLHALYPDGTPKWVFMTNGNVYDAPVIGSDGTVYFGSDDEYLYALNPDGSLKWRYRTGDEIHSSPAIGTDGTVYFTSSDGYLYALKGSGTLADAPWPKFHHDNCNTGRVGGP